MITRRQVLLSLGALGAGLVSSRITAQPAAKRYRLAVVFTTSRISEMLGPEPEHPGLRAFLATLRAAGFSENVNLVYLPRSAEGKYERYPDIFRELVGMKVDVIVTIGEAMTQKAREATTSIPIVMAYSNFPLQAGLVQSLARPGGNITGVTVNPTTEIEAKRLELLKEAIPTISRVAFLGLKAEWESPIGLSVRSAAAALGLKIYLAENSPNEFDPAFAQLAKERPDALFVANSPVNFGHRNVIVEHARKARVPATYQAEEFVTAGGLMSYGINVPDLFRRAAALVVKILQGARPAELPVDQPTTFDLAINMRTAKALGLIIPTSVLLRATRTID